MIFRDALLRLLPSSLPPSFEAMDEVEQAWRGRVFLMTWALGYPETLAWGMALNTDPEHEAWAKAMVADADDDRIRAVVQGRKEEEAASTRVGLGDLH